MASKIDVTASEAMNSPLLFGPLFDGPSWDRWRAVVKGAFAEPMNDAETGLFKAVAGNRQPPAQRVSELVVAAGRGAGKDSIAAFLACYLALTFDPAGLRPGERAHILCLAVDKPQAAIAKNYIQGCFESIPALGQLWSGPSLGSIELKNRVVIEVAVANYRSLRGRSILACIFDEAAFWRDESFASPDVEVYNAVRPGLARVPGSMAVIISSVHKRSGLLYSKIKALHGKDDTRALTVLGGTRDFNPSFDQAVIDAALAEDREKFSAEYLSLWRDDLQSWLSRDILEAAVDTGVLVRDPVRGVRYYAGCDVSGGRNDAFTAAIAHQDADGAVILDALFERRPPFSPSDVVADVSRLARGYGCSEITGDNFGAEWVREAFQKVGLVYKRSERDRSKIYQDCLPLFTSGRAKLLDNQRMVSQFAALERRIFSTGRERIDPGPGHDDLANSAALAMVSAAVSVHFSSAVFSSPHDVVGTLPGVFYAHSGWDPHAAARAAIPEPFRADVDERAARQDAARRFMYGDGQ